MLLIEVPFTLLNFDFFTAEDEWAEEMEAEDESEEEAIIADYKEKNPGMSFLYLAIDHVLIEHYQLRLTMPSRLNTMTPSTIFMIKRDDFSQRPIIIYYCSLFNE